MSGLEPGYGQTPLPFDELHLLLRQAAQALGDPVTRAAVYELEQAYEDAVREALVPRAAAGDLPLHELLTDRWLRDLHARLYENVWIWAGKYRDLEYNIGVDPLQIPTQLRSNFDNLLYRWEHTDDWNPAQLALAAHADAVRIHPFVDGNGRSTRLLADLVLLASQDDDDPPAVFDWNLDKTQYIGALRRFDEHRDPTELAGIIRLTGLAEK